MTLTDYLREHLEKGYWRRRAMIAVFGYPIDPVGDKGYEVMLKALSCDHVWVKTRLAWMPHWFWKCQLCTACKPLNP